MCVCVGNVCVCGAHVCLPSGTPSLGNCKRVHVSVIRHTDVGNVRVCVCVCVHVCLPSGTLMLETCMRARLYVARHTTVGNVHVSARLPVVRHTNVGNVPVVRYTKTRLAGNDSDDEVMYSEGEVVPSERIVQSAGFKVGTGLVVVTAFLLEHITEF